MFLELLGAMMRVAEEAEEAAREEQKNNQSKRPTAEEARRPHPCALCPDRNLGRVPKLSELITDVIVRDDYVIVYWADKTIMHVKKHANEPAFDIEKAIAMATLKYLFGNKYYSDFVEVVAKAKTVNNTTTADTGNSVDPVKKETDNVNTVEKSKSAKNKSTSKTKSTKSSKTTKAAKATSASTKTKKSSETAGTRSAKTTKSKK